MNFNNAMNAKEFIRRANETIEHHRGHAGEVLNVFIPAPLKFFPNRNVIKHINLDDATCVLVMGGKVFDKDGICIYDVVDSNAVLYKITGKTRV